MFILGNLRKNGYIHFAANIKNFLYAMLAAYISAVHVLSAWYTHRNAKAYYDSRREKCEYPKVFDVGHRLIPDQSSNQLLQYFHDYVVTFSPTLLAYFNDFFMEYGFLMLIVFAIRSAFIVSTILPKHKGCDDASFTWKNISFGHCYDKVFSGHFASLLLATVLMATKGMLSVPVAVLVNAIAAYTILALRSHYTVDLLVAALVVALVMSTRHTAYLFLVSPQ
jgi:hypothetical protein